MSITAFDIFLILLILGGGILGLTTGATRLSIPFVLTLVAITLTYTYPKLSGLYAGSDLGANFFLYLIVIFAGLVIFGIIARIIRGAISSTGLRPLDKLLGLCFGLILGSILAGTSIWGIETYGGDKWGYLLQDSKLSSSALLFFKHIMSFTERFFPQPEVKPWWKRPLW